MRGLAFARRRNLFGGGVATQYFRMRLGMSSRKRGVESEWIQF